MDSTITQKTVSTVTPDNLKTPSQNIEKPKNHKAIIWVLSILLIATIAATSVFAYLYFTNQKSTPTTSDNGGESGTTEPAEEVEITDADILSDLDTKIAILFGTDNTGSTFATGRAIGIYDEVLFHEGDISQSSKTNSVIRYTLEFSPLNEEEIVAALNQSGLTGENEKYFRQDQAKGISGDIVAQKYKEIFGKDLVKEDFGTSCGGYRYNAQYDFYYDDVLGCGGTTPYERFYYKYDYTSDGDHVYVYVATAFISPTLTTSPEGYTQENLPYYVYCDIADLNSDGVANNAEVCATLQSHDEKNNFTLDSSNYKSKYGRYRFVFDKSDDGNYYFNKVERVKSMR